MGPVGGVYRGLGPRLLGDEMTGDISRDEGEEAVRVTDKTACG